jgi:hypothetical protein
VEGDMKMDKYHEEETNRISNIVRLYEDAMAALEDNDKDKAIGLLKSAIEPIQAQDQYNWGVIYYHGIGVQKDFHKAIELFEKAADKQYGEAERALGMMLTYGIGLDIDYDKALKYLLNAENHGARNVYYVLGQAFLFGLGTNQDVDKGIEYLKMASDKYYDKSYSEAQYVLGQIYFQDELVSKDVYKAEKWLKMASSNGNEDATELLKEVEKEILKNGTIRYDDGEIEYSVSQDGGIQILNISLNPEIEPSNVSVVVVPEKIYDVPVVAIKPKALNLIKSCKIRRIILPKSIKVIGDLDIYLFEGYKVDRSSTKLAIYMDLFDYDMYTNDLKSDSKLLSKKYISDNDLKEYIEINRFMNRNGYWRYPDDGMWIDLRGNLVKYTGNETDIYVECRTVCENAFVNLNVEKITFSDKSSVFEKNMIHDCDNLEYVYFQNVARCRIAQGAIHDCENLTYLSDVKTIMDDESFYYNCPKLGNMNEYGKLRTYQGQEEVIILEEDCKIICTGSFRSCKNARIIYIPQCVKEIGDYAFAGTDINIIVFGGNDTRCSRNWIEGLNEVYIYADKKANIISCISPFELKKNVYFKNKEVLSEALLTTINVQKLKELCYARMDNESDNELIPNQYGWEKEIYRKN